MNTNRGAVEIPRLAGIAAMGHRPRKSEAQIPESLETKRVAGFFHFILSGAITRSHSERAACEIMNAPARGRSSYLSTPTPWVQEKDYIF